MTLLRYLIALTIIALALVLALALITGAHLTHLAGLTPAWWLGAGYLLGRR